MQLKKGKNHVNVLIMISSGEAHVLFPPINDKIIEIKNLAILLSISTKRDREREREDRETEREIGIERE